MFARKNMIQVSSDAAKRKFVYSWNVIYVVFSSVHVNDLSRFNANGFAIIHFSLPGDNMLRHWFNCWDLSELGCVFLGWGYMVRVGYSISLQEGWDSIYICLNPTATAWSCVHATCLRDLITACCVDVEQLQKGYSTYRYIKIDTYSV